MEVSPLALNESDRIAALSKLEILDTAPEKDYDDLVSLAAMICEAPIANIAFIDQNRAWLKAKVGVDRTEFPRNASFCACDIEHTDLIIIEDALLDDRFANLPSVVGDPYIRFYAGMPILVDGYIVGQLCVFDTQPRSLTEQQASSLKILANQVNRLLQLRIQLFFKSKEAAEASELDKQKEFYESILNCLPTDIVVFDPNHKYIFVNPGAIKNDELRKYIIGKDDFEYAQYRGRDNAIAEKRRAQFLEIKNSSKEIRWEDSIRDPDGNMITHLRRLFPVFDDNHELTMVIGFGIDITDRKLLEEKQSELVKQLSAQNTQLVDFCNIVSHNLRAPLVNMSLLSKFISESDDPDEQKMLITKLNPVIENLHSMFNELVESIQIKQDSEIQSEKIELKDCLKRTLDGLNVEISKSEAIIEHDFSEVPVIFYPPKYLFSIFHNLVSNSLKYQSPKRKPHIRLATKAHGDKVILSVKDNGLGIDLVKHRDNLFKIGKVFHRHPNSNGFGLFMTKTQIEAMGGDMWAESIPDEGSTFYVELLNQIKLNEPS